MDENQKERLEKLRYKPDITDEEMKEYQELVDMQYKTGENDPKPDTSEEEIKGAEQE